MQLLMFRIEDKFMIDDAVDEDESLHKNEVGMEGDENKT